MDLIEREFVCTALQAVTTGTADALLVTRLTLIGIDTWTEGIAEEAARTLGRHREEAIRIIGIDPLELPFVADTTYWPTDYTARSELRRLSTPLMAELGRRAQASRAGLALSWDRRDADAGALHDDVSALPGRNWTGKTWEVPITKEAAAFIKAWRFTADEGARKVLRAINKATGEQAYDVRLGELGTVVVRRIAPEIEGLPGYVRTAQGATMTLNADLLLWARRYGLSVDPEVEDALAISPEARRRSEVLAVASVCERPEQLTPEFLVMLKDALR